MNDIQAHLDKIHSDAAECLLLSNLANGDKKALFARIAGHLTSLALEIEKTIGTNSAYVVPAEPLIPTTTIDWIASYRQKTRRLRRWLPWLLIVSAGVIAGPFFLANKPIEHYSSLFTAHGPWRARQDTTMHEWDGMTEQLGTLGTRIDSLERALVNLKGKEAHPTIEGQLTETVAQTDSGNIATNSFSEENALPARDNRTTSTVDLSAARGSNAAQPASATLPGPISGARESTMNRAKLNRGEPDTRPSGCTHFRSFDAVSRTYTTFDGRRRHCR